MQNTTGFIKVSEDLVFMVYSNKGEQIFSITLIILVSLFTIISQASVICTIIKSPSLHNVHFFIMATYCAVDLVVGTTIAPAFVTQFINGTLPLLHCRVISDIVISLILGMTYHTGLIAFERYMYFCQPFAYLRVMTVKIVGAAMALGYIIPLCMILTTEITIGRVYHTSILSCNLPDTGVQSLIQFTVIMLPSAVITIFSTVKIWRLSKNSLIHPANVSGNNGPIVHPVVQAKKCIKMILLVSGTFWGTIIPGYIVRIIIYNMGYTFEDLDTRRYLVPSLLMRVTTFIYSIVSSAVNPLIHFYSRKDLRDAFLKIVKPSTVFVD